MPDPLFIVAPGRSYTSVIGGMIGQHPELYGLPELNLSVADTMGEFMQRLKGPLQFGQAGLLRFLAQHHSGEQSEEAVLEARSFVMQRAHWSTRRMFEHIQEQAGEDRILVEKSPLNVMRPENLNRLHEIFPGANYLHLARHPLTACKSSLALREKVRGGMEGATGGRVRGLDPETGWSRAHEHILDLGRRLALGQMIRVKGEMLLSDPAKYLAQICDWLGVSSGPEAIEAMMHPENSPYASLGPPSARYGNDPNYLEQPALDLERLKRIKEPPLDGPATWREGEDGASLWKPTLRMARQFGYG